MMRRLAGRYLPYYLPGFHPWDDDNRAKPELEAGFPPHPGRRQGLFGSPRRLRRRLSSPPRVAADGGGAFGAARPRLVCHRDG
jgi:hypothetical protein